MKSCYTACYHLISRWGNKIVDLFWDQSFILIQPRSADIFFFFFIQDVKHASFKCNLFLVQEKRCETCVHSPKSWSNSSYLFIYLFAIANLASSQFFQCKSQLAARILLTLKIFDPSCNGLSPLDSEFKCLKAHDTVKTWPRAEVINIEFFRIYRFPADMPLLCYATQYIKPILKIRHWNWLNPSRHCTWLWGSPVLASSCFVSLNPLIFSSTRLIIHISGFFTKKYNVNSEY